MRLRGSDEAANVGDRETTLDASRGSIPNGESYQQVVDRVSRWLGEAMRHIDAGTVLMIGHRATFYALEHLLNHVTLHEVVTSPWKWQPGWTYHLRSSPTPGQRFLSSFTTGC
jgi:broad specificity phosphatase PhoE